MKHQRDFPFIPGRFITNVRKHKKILHVDKIDLKPLGKSNIFSAKLCGSNQGKSSKRGKYHMYGCGLWVIKRHFQSMLADVLHNYACKAYMKHFLCRHNTDKVFGSPQIII